jgi:hypothetical protein
MSRGLTGLLIALVLIDLTRGVAAAQTGAATAPLTGIVIDGQDAVLAGVTVVVRNNATGVSLAPVVTNRAGLFSVASLDPGTYTVTFSLRGFKTAVMSDVRLATATPNDLKVTLEVGAVTETITVNARSEVVQRRSTAVASTLHSDQIRNLPLNSRDATNFVTLLPGVDTGGNHQLQNNTRIAGLPASAMLISIDGLQTQQPQSKSFVGFQSIISPTVDAVEEVTLSSATPGADASGQGAVQIRFTTRSGTNRYAGAFFETLRHSVLNANTFFNEVNGVSLNRLTLNQFGGNVGGPVILPGLDLRGKAFFFANFEELRQQSDVTRMRTLLIPTTASGLFSYTAGGVVRQVNVLTVAGANGQITAVDPTVRSLIDQIAAAAATTGSIKPNVDANTSLFAWNSPEMLDRRHSNNRIDLNLNDRHRLSAIVAVNKYYRDPDTPNSRDPKFPGLPNSSSIISYRHSATGILRSTLASNLVNEAASGLLWIDGSAGVSLSPAQFSNQGGYSLMLASAGAGVFSSLAPATAAALTGSNGTGNHAGTNSSALWSLADKISWQRGRHDLELGVEATSVRNMEGNQQIVPSFIFGVDPTNDPASAMFTTANFPGASNASLADARHLYGLLTGRVSQITTELALDPATGQYAANTFSNRRGHVNEAGLFAQDAFRVVPNLTVNVGLRYELQQPFRPDNSTWSANTIDDACGRSGVASGLGGRPCNFFKPGTLTGVTPTYKQYATGTNRYATDLNNVAPSVGIAWLPSVKTGMLRGILGDPEQATVRASYARAFTREGMDPLNAPYEANPGASLSLVRSAANGNLVLPGESWPLLLRETSRLGPGAFPPTPSYPLPIDRTAGVNLFDPHWEVGSADSFSAGIQRSISRSTAVEVRYVSMRGRNLLDIENWNEINIVENAFLDEFKLAQVNLYANIDAGRGQTIRYFGPGTGTTPLPTYLAYLTGSSQSGDATAYTGTGWTNATIVGRFARLNPDPVASAVDLFGNATFRANALGAGVPANFFVLNPDVTGVNVRVSKGSTRYDALQVELRRRLSRGLAMTASYAYVTSRVSRLDSVRVNRELVPDVGAVPHSLKLTTSYEVPFGHHTTGASGGAWPRLAGGWSVNLTGKITSGAVLNFGNVRLVGMSLDDLQRSIKYRIEPAVVNADGTTTPARVYNLPDDIIVNTTRAFSVNVSGYTAGTPTGKYLAPANGPTCIQVLRGDCAPKDVVVTAPVFSRFDLGLQKKIPLGGTKQLVLEADVLNLFNAINFNPVGLPANPANLDSYRVTTSYQDVSQMSDPGSRIGQLVFRFNW